MTKLTVDVLGPLDLITSKLARGDDADLDDIEHVIRHEGLSGEQVRRACEDALVPAELEEIVARSRVRLEHRLTSLGL